jgi:putative chitinase
MAASSGAIIMNNAPVVTAELLQSAMQCTRERAEKFSGHLNAACNAFQIDTPSRLAMFLAQIGHESGGLAYVEELASGDAYEGRKDLGNTQPGDGRRYKGRGLIQITGRANYAKTRDELDAVRAPDFEATPSALALPQWAAWSAAAYWHWTKLNALADAGKFDAITQRINGGQNGAEDRRRRWDIARAAIAAASTTKVDPPAEEPAMPKAADILTSPATSFILGAVNPLLAVVPELARIFTDKAGTTVPERNVAAAVKLVETAQKALAGPDIPAPNAQAVVEAVAADPEARAAVRQAVLSDPYWLAEAGGGGIEGARKADAATSARRDFLYSPSFWIACALLPLVYMIVGSIVGLWGQEWPTELRASIATAIVSLVVGSLAGYYYGTNTSRNRTPAPTA